MTGLQSCNRHKNPELPAKPGIWIKPLSQTIKPSLSGGIL